MADLATFALVAQHGGFRQAARAGGQSASALSEALRRLENQLGIRLLLRTTRSVTPTEAGAMLLARLQPALAGVAGALDVLNDLRDSPRGTLRLNVPVSAARFFLQPLVNRFMRAYPDIVLDVVIDNNFVDVVASGCDAGIRYGERLEQDMIALPIGPRPAIWRGAACRNTRATCCDTPACAASFSAEPSIHGNSRATARR